MYRNYFFLAFVFTTLNFNLVFSQQTVDSVKVKNFQIAAVVLAIFTPDDNFLSPVVYIDYKRFHFEPRYNYENLETFSTFVGYHFKGGKKIKYLVTPMLGGVVGKTNGIAPGLEFDISLGRFGIYSEMEYLLDADHSADSYFYSWTKIRFIATKWLILGVAGGRNRIYKNDVKIQRGVCVGFVKGKNVLTGYYYNPFTPENYGSIAFFRTF